jgi:hypothetical protein
MLISFFSYKIFNDITLTLLWVFSIPHPLDSRYIYYLISEAFMAKRLFNQEPYSYIKKCYSGSLRDKVLTTYLLSNSEVCHRKSMEHMDTGAVELPQYKV